MDYRDMNVSVIRLNVSQKVQKMYTSLTVSVKMWHNYPKIDSYKVANIWG